MNPPPMVFVVFVVFAKIPIDSIWVAKKNGKQNTVDVRWDKCKECIN